MTYIEPVMLQFYIPFETTVGAALLKSAEGNSFLYLIIPHFPFSLGIMSLQMLRQKELIRYNNSSYFGTEISDQNRIAE